MSYGKELILDLYECDPATFTRIGIEQWLIALCKEIDMKREDLHFWDDVGVSKEEQQTSPHTTGTSAVQFILTSSIVIHTLDLVGECYINIFSCKDFDTESAAKFTGEWFKSSRWAARVVERGRESKV